MKVTANFFCAGSNRFHPRYISSASTKPGTKKAEEDYIDLAKLGRKLFIPILETHVALSVKEPGGEEREVYRDRSRTFNRNWWNQIFLCGSSGGNVAAFNQVYGQGCTFMRDTNGTNISASFNNNPNNPTAVTCFGPNGATLGVATQGIVIGTGRREEFFNAITLHAQIASGNGAGQMLHSAQNALTGSWDPVTDKFSIVHTRIFNNNSGGTIVIGEVGIQGANTSGMSVNPFLLCRDLLPSPVSVINAAQLTVTYTISLTFPAGVVNDPPFVGGATGQAARTQQGMQQVSSTWYQQRDPRNWVTTEQWQEYQYRNFKQ